MDTTFIDGVSKMALVIGKYPYLPYKRDFFQHPHPTGNFKK